MLCAALDIINHPVHIKTKEDLLAPSALIPFCEFGGNMSSVGVNIDQFDIPVCTSFEATVLNDQLCYEVDLNRFADKNNIDKQIELGFNFIMDYNEDRQLTFERNTSNIEEVDLANRIAESNQQNQAFIYLNTIGENI